MMRTLRTTAFLFALAGSSAWAQEPVGPPAPHQDSARGQGADPVEEMVRLFQEVERKLIAIDAMLGDAGAGEIPLTELDDSGLDDLLRAGEGQGDGSGEGSGGAGIAGLLNRASREGEDVAAGIDRLLELAQEMNGSSGGSSQSGQSSGESPLDQPRDGGPLDREKTPEAPSRPEEGEKEQGQSESKPGDGEPELPLEDDGHGENRTGDPRADDPANPVPPGMDADQWGFLPPRTRQIFRNQGRDDLPIQYRDWIDTYYRRLATQNR